VHPEALDVLQVAGQLRRVGMDDYVDQDGQEVVRTCGKAIAA